MTGEQGAESIADGGLGPTSDVGASKPARRNGRYDAGHRRQSKRTGREAGCWLYIAAEQLDKTGYGEGQPAPFYRVWGGPRGRLTIQLYREG